jgi:hypothetical protein
LDVASWITQPQQRNKWRFIPGLIPGARRLCADLNCFFAAIFGSRCLGQAWKKESLASDRLSRRPCAPSMHNTWLDDVHQFMPPARTPHSVQARKLSGQRGVPLVVPNPAQKLAHKFQVFLGRRNEMPNDFSRPLQAGDAKTLTGKHS